MMKGKNLVFVCFFILWALAPAKTQANQLTLQGINDRFAVTFADGVSESMQLEFARKHRLEVMRVFRPINTLIVTPMPGQTIMVKEILRVDPLVYFISDDFYANWIDAKISPEEEVAQLDVVMNTPAQDPLPVEQEPPAPKEDPQDNKEVQWGVARVNAPAAWDTNQGAGVKVAIVDTGIDPNHPDLKANIRGGHNAVDKESPWADDHFHGTHVAGIVAAALNGEAVVGVAPKADLYAVKVLTKEGSGSIFGIIGGLMWCIENGMNVVNMSLGAPQDNFLFKYAVGAVNNAGIAMVVAAGNDGKAVNFPAAYESTIAVSALDKDDTIVSFSSRGPEIDFIAPGVKIPSTVTGGGVEAYSGTSMACPHVAGLAALAVAKGAKGLDQVRSVLSANAQKLPNLSADEQGKGLVNAAGLSQF
ncbi:S8 family peptidase [Elusimicrobiota bacterium]